MSESATPIEESATPVKKSTTPIEESAISVQTETPKKTSNIDAFFSQSDSDADIKEFVGRMKTPREKIEAPPLLFGDEAEEEEGDLPDDQDLPGDTDDQMIEHLNFTEEHKYTAEFILIQLDKMLAFSFSLVSGMDSERYRRRLTKIEGDDYEAEIAAALIKKYQMRLGLEWMLVSALVIGYSPMLNKAIKDKKEHKKGDATKAKTI